MSNTQSYEKVIYDQHGGSMNSPAAPQEMRSNAVVFRPLGKNPVTYGDMFPEYFDVSGNQGPLQYVDVYPGPSNVHENAALTDFATRFELDSQQFISNEIAPIFTVDRRSDVFYKVSKEDVVRAQDTERAVGAAANEIQQGFDTDTYTVVSYGLRDFLPDEMVNNADEALDLMSGTTRFLTQVLGFDRDLRALALLTTGNFSNDAAGGFWDAATATNKNIQKDFNTANTSIIQGNLGMGMNKFLVSSTTALAMAASNEIQDSAKHVIGDTYVINGGWPGPNYGLPERTYGAETIVQAIPTNTAKKGQTAVFADSFTDNAFFVRVEAPSRRTRNAITTFRVGGMRTRTYRDENRNGTFIEVGMAEEIRITNTEGGHLITNVIT